MISAEIICVFSLFSFVHSFDIEGSQKSSQYLGETYVRLPPLLGSNSFACFSTDTWLTTPTGKKRMDQIAVGDEVLSSNATMTFYTPVIMWMHREPEDRYKFHTVMTEYGKMLALTAKHLIYRNQCDDNYSDYVKTIPKHRDMVYAENLKVGDCLVLLYKGKYRQQRIKKITITERKGIFAPITSNGRLIVNDIVASCFSDIKQVKFQMRFFKLVSTIQSFMKIFGDIVYNKVTIPVGNALAFDFLRLVIPFSS